MGIFVKPYGVRNYKSSYKVVTDESSTTRVALWQIPYDKRYSSYDIDESHWFESVNQYSKNEIEKVEKDLQISLRKFKVQTKTLTYHDSTQEVISKYPNGNEVIERISDDYTTVQIKDNNGRLVAEKMFNYSSNEGRKIIYKHYEQGKNTFTVVRVYTYDTTKNKKSDIVNYGYTSLPSTLTKECTLEKEYYLLNDIEVKAKQTGDFEFVVKDENGNKLTFTVE